MRFGTIFAAVGIVTIVVLLEAFNRHPQFSIGDFHAYWSGFRQMEFTSSKGTNTLVNGQTEIYKGYDFGPLKVAIVHVL